MSIKNRLDKLETLNANADYSGLTQDELSAQIKVMLVKRRGWGCPNCDPCRQPKLCADIEGLIKQLGLMDGESV